MNQVIAGRFEQQLDAQRALDALVRAGFPQGAVGSIFVNPAGQHASYPIGGDRDVSPGAHEATSGAGVGAAIGAVAGIAVGVAALPVLGPAAVIAGAGAGAYTGSLGGSMSQMASADETAAPHGTAIARRSGMLVGVDTENEDRQQLAISILLQLGAQDIEYADGHILAGSWDGFDAVKWVRPVDPVTSGNGFSEADSRTTHPQY